MPEILTKENALPQLIAPTGHQYAVVPSDKVPGTHRIVRTDGVQVSLSIQGVYTGKMRAEKALREFLNNRWQESEDAEMKNAKRKSQVASA